MNVGRLCASLKPYYIKPGGKKSSEGKKYTYLIIHIMDVSLKILEGEPNETKPCEGKRVYHV